MSGKKEKPSVIRQAFNNFVDKVIDFTESEDIIDTNGKEGFKLRGQDADLFLVRCKTKAQKTESRTTRTSHGT